MFCYTKTTGAAEVKVESLVDVISCNYHTKFHMISLHRYGEIASKPVHTQFNGLIPFLFSIPHFVVVLLKFGRCYEAQILSKCSP